MELLSYLDAGGSRNYIASGGGRDFMRPISQELYGVPRQRVIGSSVSLAWNDDGHRGTLIHKPEVDVLDDGPAKPVRIWSRVGRRPRHRTATSRCWPSPPSPGSRRCGCWCCMMTRTASSTTSWVPSRHSSWPAPEVDRGQHQERLTTVF